jgi:hypothetical protein
MPDTREDYAEPAGPYLPSWGFLPHPDSYESRDLRNAVRDINAAVAASVEPYADRMFEFAASINRAVRRTPDA